MSSREIQLRLKSGTISSGEENLSQARREIAKADRKIVLQIKMQVEVTKALKRLSKGLRGIEKRDLDNYIKANCGRMSGCGEGVMANLPTRHLHAARHFLRGRPLREIERRAGHHVCNPYIIRGGVKAALWQALGRFWFIPCARLAGHEVDTEPLQNSLSRCSPMVASSYERKRAWRVGVDAVARITIDRWIRKSLR